MTPTIGRIVHYTLSGADVIDIDRHRQLHEVGVSGNAVLDGQVFPAMVVRVWGDGPNAPVNLRVFLDADDVPYWVPSRVQGEGPGTWKWPERT